MRRSALFLALISAAACSSSGGGSVPSVAPTPNTSRVTTGSGSTVKINTMNIDTDVRLFSTGTPDQVFAVLPAVYTELGIPLSLSDPRTKSVGNTGWKTRRSIGKVPMQRYLDCGSSGTLQNAETYQVHMSVVTSVRPNPSGGAIVSTSISGTGKNPVTSSSAEVRCSSMGNLEIRIRDMVQKRIEAM